MKMRNDKEVKEAIKFMPSELQAPLRAMNERFTPRAMEIFINAPKEDEGAHNKELARSIIDRIEEIGFLKNGSVEVLRQYLGGEYGEE